MSVENLSCPIEPGSAESERQEAIAEVIKSVITPESILRNLEALQPPAPTTTVLYTRTPIITELLLEAGVPREQINPRFLQTRSPAAILGERQAIWFVAHADQPTYLPPAPTNELNFNLMAICAHRLKVTGLEFPALVLRFIPERKLYETVSEGVIGTNDDMTPYYKASVKPRDGFLTGYDRVVFSSALAQNSENVQLWTGNMDNAAGIAVSITAIKALMLLKNKGLLDETLSIGCVFPDGEEGRPENPAYFARGARVIAHRTPPDQLPEYVVNVDGHDINDLQPTAAYAAYVSGGKGPIVPPDVYARFEELLQRMATYGSVQVQRTEGVGTVSRSDDAGFMEVHDQIMPFGYWVRDPHHNQGLPTINLEGLVNTSRALVGFAVYLR